MKESDLSSRFDIEIKNNTSHSSKMVYIVSSVSKIIVPDDKCYPRNICRFENVQLYTFADPECYLRNHYGTNFDVWPKEEDRTNSIDDIYYT